VSGSHATVWHWLTGVQTTPKQWLSRQLLRQASLSTLFASSHSSLASTRPLPHTSFRHAPEQPSPLTVLPSSHSSAQSLRPSPHTVPPHSIPPIWTGTRRFVLVPSPTVPDSLPPQHHSVPSAFDPQVVPLPVLTRTHSPPATCTGESLDAVVPSPRRPSQLAPQHHSVPSLRTAQV
jgi:hypothetical protein